MTTYYKALKPGRVAPMTGWQWPEPGEWTEPIAGELIECSKGYHVVTDVQLLDWLQLHVWTVEVKDPVVGDGKTVVRQARLDRQAMGPAEVVGFAADCAEHVLHLFEQAVPGDDRPRKAIAAARDAARDAAGAAAWAAWAAWDAAGAAWAAWDAAGAAARDAAWAARDAAWAAWAAWDAAGAAWAAWDAAGAAARDAARDAAWDAARDAEREWQLAELRRYLSA